MAWEVTVVVTGLDEAIAKNNALAATLQDWTDALLGLGKTLTDYYSQASWATDGIIWGEKWRALKTATTNEKTRSMKESVTGIGGGAQPLIRSGDMKAGFRPTVTPRTLYIDNKMEYWKYHQTGTTYQGDATPGSKPGRGKNLPQRITAGINEPVKAMIQAAIGEAVKEKITAAMS